MQILDFDPTTFTVAQLRKVLNLHAIQYDSSAPKSTLIEIFNKEIAPNSKKLLSEYNAKVENMNDDGFVNASDVEKPSEKSTTSEKASTLFVSDTESDDSNEKINVSKSRNKTKKISKPKSRASSGTRNSTSRSTSRTKSPESESDTESKDDEAKPASRSSSRLSSRSNRSKPLNSLFDLDDSVLNIRKSSKNTKAKLRNTLKLKTKKTIESTPEVTESSDIEKEKVEQQAKKETEKVEQPAKKEIHKESTPENTNFSKENVFQSPPGSSTKKRKHQDAEEGDDSTLVKKIKPSQRTAEENRSLFEDDNDSDVEFIEEFIRTETKKKAPVARSGSTQTRAPSSSSKKEHKKKETSLISPGSASKIKKPKSLSKRVTPKKSGDRSVSSPTTNEKSFKSIEDETKDFDAELKKIQSKKNQSQASPDLAKLLGITIQGFEPPVVTPSKAKDLTPAKDESTPVTNIEKQLIGNNRTSRKETPKNLNRSNEKPKKTYTKIQTARKRSSNTLTPSAKIKSTKKLSPLVTKSALTPKPRLISLGSQKYETDDESDEEDISELTKPVSPTKNDSANASTKHFALPFSIRRLLLSMFLWVLICSGGLFGLWYYEQKYAVGYCGQEIDLPTFANSDNEYLNKLGQVLDTNFKPECINCPLHARCYTNLEIGCFEDFMEYKPWYDFIVPGHKKCIPDTKKAEKLEIMIDVALDLLRSKNAAIQCGQNPNDEESGIKLNDLHDLLLSMKAPYITIDEFEELWDRSVIELEKEPDIIVRQVR